MKLASTGWMKRHRYGSCYEVSRGLGTLCTQSLQSILGVPLTVKDEEIRVTMYSHYVKGSNEVVLYCGYNGYFGFFKGPRAYIPYTRWAVHELLVRNKTVCRWIERGQRKTVYLLTETRELR